MVTANDNPSLRDLRKQTGLTAQALADRITDILGETKRRSAMSVIMMEARGRMSDANVRDALIAIFRGFNISEDVVKSACRK